MKKIIFYVTTTILGVFAFVLQLLWSVCILLMRPIYKWAENKVGWNVYANVNKRKYDYFWKSLRLEYDFEKKRES